MSENGKWISDLQKVHETAKETVGAFLYEPFGFESSDTVNAVTFYALLVLSFFVLYRIFKPVHKPRIRHADRYDFGRGL
ncbi:hypothetical protein ACW9UR_02525 [Halovulum sp. GXIMD14794]